MEDIRDALADIGHRNVALIDRDLAAGIPFDTDRLQALLFKASMYLYEGQPRDVY